MKQSLFQFKKLKRIFLEDLCERIDHIFQSVSDDFQHVNLLG